MAATARKPATYADIEALPEHLVGQILDGELIVQPRPALEHAGAATSVGADLVGPFMRGRGGPGGWWILFEPELHLGRDVLVPDLAGWRHARVPAQPRGPFIEIAPDWVCEVLSPGTATVDRARKLPKYARAEVGHVWLVDTSARTLEVFRRDGVRWLLLDVHAGEARVRAEPFDAIELELAPLWPQEAPSER